MKKIIIVCGIIGGLISSAWFFVSDSMLADNLSINARIWLGYTSMILSFSLIFVGVKNFRDNFNGGEISFGKAFRMGLLITLIASTVYVAVWLISYKFLFPDFAEKYAAETQREMQAQGASAAEIKSKMVEMVNYAKLYQNPLFNILMTYSEIFPVGLVISVIAALILKKKPAAQAAIN